MSKQTVLIVLVACVWIAVGVGCGGGGGGSSSVPPPASAFLSKIASGDTFGFGRTSSSNLLGGSATTRRKRELSDQSLISIARNPTGSSGRKIRVSYCVDTAPKPLQLLCYPDKVGLCHGRTSCGPCPAQEAHLRSLVLLHHCGRIRHRPWLPETR